MSAPLVPLPAPRGVLTGAGRQIQPARVVKATLLYLSLTAVALVILAPLLWMLSSSFRPADEILTAKAGWIPSRLTLENYTGAFQAVPLARYFANSVFVATAVMLCNLFFCSLTGYGLAKFQFPARNVVFLLILSTMMIPGQLSLVPLFLIVNAFGWINTYWAVIVPGMISAFGIFFTRQVMVGIPDEILDAARVDGANEWNLFWKVTLPRLRPIMLILVVLRFGTAMAVIEEFIIMGGLNSAMPTYTWTVYMWHTAFSLGSWPQGYAAAMGWLGALSMLAVVAFLFWVFRDQDSK